MSEVLRRAEIRASAVNRTNRFSFGFGAAEAATEEKKKPEVQILGDFDSYEPEADIKIEKWLRMPVTVSVDRYGITQIFSVLKDGSTFFAVPVIPDDAAGNRQCLPNKMTGYMKIRIPMSTKWTRKVKDDGSLVVGLSQRPEYVDFASTKEEMLELIAKEEAEEKAAKEAEKSKAPEVPEAPEPPKPPKKG